MGEQVVNETLSGEKRRAFMRQLLSDLRALEKMLEDGWIEEDVRRIGAEQEMFLVDSNWRPAPKVLEVLDVLDDPHYTSELAQFNLEANLDPHVFGGDCLSRMHAQLVELVDKARAGARKVGADIILCGILPTLRQADLGLDNMTPLPRYFALNRALSDLRGSQYEFHIKGIDELIVKHDSVMLESCNTSFQVHFQVAPGEFAKLYNISQAVAAPLLAAASNSPLLFGRRLWRETRIALFQQAVDTRSTSDALRESSPRVWFGRRWVDDSVTELFKEDIARFRALLSTEVEENALAKLDKGIAPDLRALKMHNGTVYRWNRACYGQTDGKPHLRIENRILPSGPTPLDEVANAALWFGLISNLASAYDDIRDVMDFEHAQENFDMAARNGLQAEFQWIGGKAITAHTLLKEELLPAAREGLERGGVNADDINRYLGVLEERVDSRQTGSSWILSSMKAFDGAGTPGERFNALTVATMARQADDKPVHTWGLASLEEGGGWKSNYMKVEQFMSTDLFTVQQDEPIDLVANLMHWEHIRHVPVEDSQHRLVGLISYRGLLRMLAENKLFGSDGKSMAISDVMKRDPITISPETTTLEAIETMKKYDIGCLPVVKDGKLVGVITQGDFMAIARELLEQKLRE